METLRKHQFSMACFFWFLILSNSFAYSSAAFTSIYYLNSTLTSTWSNSNSINMNITTTDGSQVRPILVRQKSLGFACGFYSINNTSSYLFSIVLIGGANPVVVWSANRDQPVGENAEIELTRNGNLVLKDTVGSDVWTTNTTGKSVAGMNMTELGNLVLFDSKGNVVWQSFDSPTDTLLAGQRLYEGQKLISSSSNTNWSQGLYYATLSMSSGFSAYTQVAGGLPQMYYQLKPILKSSVSESSLRGRCRLLMNEDRANSSSNDGANYAELQSGGFMVNLGNLYRSGIGSTRSLSDSVIEYVKITSDGHLKLYRYGNGTQTEAIDMVTRDLGECQHPRTCGDYGICKDGKCSCPARPDGGSYFERPQTLSKSGCARITPLSCKANEEQLVEVKNGSYFNLIDSDAAVPNITDIEGCKRACQQKCTCGAVFFKYDRNVSNGFCYMPTDVLSIREGEIPSYNFSSATFLKVEISNGDDMFPPKRKRRHLAAVIAGIVSATLLIVISLIVAFLAKHRKAKAAEEERAYIRRVPGMPVRFSFKELRAATTNFRERLGVGGFGTVYKGTLQDGTLIAVKRLDKLGQSMREFLAEVETIGSIHHFNLVRLIGFCAEKSSCLLVYEFMFNGSLENWIFGSDQRPVLDWKTRKKIILDIAKGLAYLHEECRQRIIHLDIKPQNILLDEQFNAKISDFGLSKLVDRDNSQVLTTLRGTPGYIAPECGNSNVTVKADIYSFGIVLLEIVSGRRNLDTTRSESTKHLLYLLQKKAMENEILDIVENLEEEMEEVRDEMERMIRIAAWCLQNDPTKRPLMSTVVKVLEGVMEVDRDIKFRFIYAMTTPSAVTPPVSAAPQASVLSNPR